MSEFHQAEHIIAYLTRTLASMDIASQSIRFVCSTPVEEKYITEFTLASVRVEDPKVANDLRCHLVSINPQNIHNLHV